MKHSDWVRLAQDPPPEWKPSKHPAVWAERVATGVWVTTDGFDLSRGMTWALAKDGQWRFLAYLSACNYAGVLVHLAYIAKNTGYLAWAADGVTDRVLRRAERLVRRVEKRADDYCPYCRQRLRGQ